MLVDLQAFFCFHARKSKVEVTIHPLKDGRKGGFDVSVKLPDGKMIYNLPHAN
jgi:hypothetical protein